MKVAEVALAVSVQVLTTAGYGGAEPPVAGIRVTTSSSRSADGRRRLRSARARRLDRRGNTASCAARL
jgi:hypothetical protein